MITLPLLLFLAQAPPAAPAGPHLCAAAQRTGAAIQQAIDECHAQGGGVAYVPPGTYTTGPIWLKDNVELRLEAGATIELSQNPADWPEGKGNAIINARGARNIALTGRGTIDGKAQYEYTPMKRLDIEINEEMEIARKAGVKLERYYRTGVQKEVMLLEESSNIVIEGVRLIHSPVWTLHLQDCDQVWIRGVYLFSDLERGVNADGIDIVSSSNVTISDSTIITADDAIVLKTFRSRRAAGDPNRPVRPVENVVVTNCVLSSSSTPMMIGTETHADIRHVIFSNIVVRDSNKVFGINVQDGATVSDVRFHNVTFKLNRRHWNWWGSAEVFKFVLKKREPASRLGRIENIVIDGAQGRARGTSLLAGHAERPLRNITVKNVRVEMLPENRPDLRTAHGMVIERVDGLTLQDIDLEWNRDPGQSTWSDGIVLRDVSGLRLRDVQAAAGGKSGVAIRKERVREQ